MCRMNKLYNTQEDIANTFVKIFKDIHPTCRKTVLNILPYLIFASIKAESVVASDMAKELKGKFSFVQMESVIKRIRRFFKNKLFNSYLFYDMLIQYVIKNYKLKHNDKRVHIIFDHMFSKDNYTVFMITMRVGKQGIPLWWRVFKGYDNPEAFEENLLKDGISYVSNLFGKDYDLIFLADRWFNSSALLQHINDLGHTFCIRFRKNIKVFLYDKKEKHKIWKFLEDVEPYVYKSRILEDVSLYNEQFKVNIVFSKSTGVKEPWIVVTNGDTKRAIKDYGYRFGGIECVFKNQKSNGFYLENTVNASLKYFETQYMLACIDTLLLTIIGSDYEKNTKCYRNTKIKTHKMVKGKKIRMLSLFNTGLTIFKMAFNSPKYIRLPLRFILYDS